jgi:carboxyl-terminal processing protease
MSHQKNLGRHLIPLLTIAFVFYDGKKECHRGDDEFMERTVSLIWLVATLTLVAAPRPAAPSRESYELANNYTLNLQLVVELVATSYVHPIPVNDLYAAALEGLYFKAGKERPQQLIKDLRQKSTTTERLGVVRKARLEIISELPQSDGSDLRSSILAVTRLLDAHSTLIPNSQMEGTESIRLYGFEFHSESADGTVPPSVPFMIQSVKTGTPAQKAGLRPADLILSIDDVMINLLDAKKAYDGLIHFEPNEFPKHTLLVERQGLRKPFHVTLAAKAASEGESFYGVSRKPDNSWNYWLDPKARIAYFRLGAIESNADSELASILLELGNINGLIFDLRWCPGGYIDPAAQIARMFLENGIIAKMSYRNREENENATIRADGGLSRVPPGDYPLLLLVNGQTIGGGELIAAALKDNNRALVAGSRTFGKATIQTANPLNSLAGYTFKLTTGTYSRPNGKNLQRYPESKPSDDWGIRPDPGYEIPMSADLSKQMLEWHTRFALRPGDSKEQMELDDPEADPQRLRCVKLLRKMMEKKEKK